MNVSETLKARIKREFDDFINSLYSLSRKEIISKSYEKIFKEDIVTIVCKEDSLIDADIKTARALDELEKPLEYLYQHWLRTDYSYMDDLRMSIIEAIKKV